MPFTGPITDCRRAMTDPHWNSIEPEGPDEILALEYLGYGIRLQPTPLEWMAVVTRPNQRPGVVLAADREAALIKAQKWIAVQAKSLG
jgi:hypothetical protein